ncbi:MAG: NAD(P)H-hydrate epimerase [Planctomycetes bacterium]|nr:NAD(P)H-hydrate epimerase [Planctomycetota bacterium]
MIGLTREEMRAADRRAIEVAGIPAIALMENAGRAVAEEAVRMAPRGPVALVCGRGSNGGDGFVAARHLDNRGVAVRVVALEAGRLEGEALLNYRALKFTGAAVSEHAPSDLEGIRAAVAGSALVVDAIFGTGLSGPLREPFPALIEELNSLGLPILAVDIPSGLDCDTGLPLGAAIRASRTLTMHAPKVGFSRGCGPGHTGTVAVADIGIPRLL